MSRESATAFAPASVGNVGIGFDILGFAVDALGDRVRATRSKTPGSGNPTVPPRRSDNPLKRASGVHGLDVNMAVSLIP